ncbi:hypothetical protein HYT45_01975 [Candidatus Uhrbacteria bacterium]|nr:hypothetical protein [Candidatus Uhrbacteria bacterium]
MKTLFIVITQGIPARNVLRTAVFKVIREHPNLRIVIFLPDRIPDEYRREFNYGNVVFEPIKKIIPGWFRRNVFTQLMINMVDTETAYIHARYGNGRRKRSLKNFLIWILCGRIFSRFGSVKKAFRWMEYTFYRDRYYKHFFDKYNPDLVFSTSILGNVDMMMLKEAKRRGVKTVAMPKSWDTFDKYLFRVAPDWLIVYNESLKTLASKSQLFPKERIRVLGFPQFDIYSERIFAERGSFLKSLGLDPSRKVIFFGSGGFFGPNDEDIADILAKMVNSGETAFPCSLIIRSHFADGRANRFSRFAKEPNVYVDDKHRRSDIFTELGDPTREDMIHLANLLNVSDVTVNPASTLSLDAITLGKPVICVAFDGYKKLKKRDSIENNLFKTSYYTRVVATGGVRVAKSMEEFKDFINLYLRHPEEDAEAREIMRKVICNNPDGQAALRIGEFIVGLLD